MFAHSRDPHPAIKLWCEVPFTKSKTFFEIEMYCMQCFFKSKCIIVEISMVKIGELLRKFRSLRSCFHILPPGALTPQGIEGAMKRDVSKHWCILQWCASRGWVIAHENWTSCNGRICEEHAFHGVGNVLNKICQLRWCYESSSAIEEWDQKSRSHARMVSWCRR